MVVLGDPPEFTDPQTLAAMRDVPRLASNDAKRCCDPDWDRGVRPVTTGILEIAGKRGGLPARAVLRAELRILQEESERD